MARLGRGRPNRPIIVRNPQPAAEAAPDPSTYAVAAVRPKWRADPVRLKWRADPVRLKWTAGTPQGG